MKPISNRIRELLIEALIESKPDKKLNEIIEELELPIHKSRLSVLLINPL